MRLESYPGLSGLDALKDDWRALLDRIGHVPYHLDFEWFHVYCRHAFPDDTDLHFFAVRDDDGAARAIFPLERRTELIRRIPNRIWALVGSRESDVLSYGHAADFVCAEQAESARYVEVLLSHLVKLRPRAGMLLLGRFLPGSNAAAVEGSRPVDNGFAFQRGGFDGFVTRGTFSAHLDSLSAKFRSNLRNRQSKLAKAGKVEYHVVSVGEPGFAAAYGEFLAIEESGWKGEQGSRSSLRYRHRERGFIEALIRESCDVCPQVHQLRVNGTTIASQLWLAFRDQLVNLKVAYDESWQRMSPGQILLGRVLERAFENPRLNSISMLTHRGWHGEWGPQFNLRRWIYLPLPGLRSLVPSALLRLPKREELGLRR